MSEYELHVSTNEVIEIIHLSTSVADDFECRSLSEWSTTGAELVQDPTLTDLGIKQSQLLHTTTKDTVQSQAQLVVSFCVSSLVRMRLS